MRDALVDDGRLQEDGDQADASVETQTFTHGAARDMLREHEVSIRVTLG